MAYNGSKATSGRATIVSLGGVSPSTGTQTWTLIGETSMASPSGAQWGTEDVTNFQSGNTEEFITTILDPGQISISGNRISLDAGQIALQAAFNAAQGGGLKYYFQLILPLEPGQTSVGDTYVYSVLVQNYEFTVQPKSAIKFSAKLKISGSYQFTEGS